MLDWRGLESIAQLTWPQKMIRLLVPDRAVTFRIRPPWRCSDIAFGIGVMRLLLGLDKLDESLTHYLASRLLHLLEADKVEAFDPSLITDH